MRSVKEARLDYLYRLMLTAQRSKAHGGHYHCTYDSAALMLQVMLGERPDLENDPYFQPQNGFNPEWSLRGRMAVAYHDLFLKIKTPNGWKSGFERKKKRTK